MAGSSNFVQHNPGEANQQTDGTFAADSTTTGGIGVDQIMPSPWMNKRWYQDSTMVAALGLMMANKGYVVSDANLATLATVLANLVTQSDLKFPLVTVGYSPTPTFPASTANGFDIVLGGNVTSSAFDVAPNIGQVLTFVVTQTGAGGATFVPPATVNGWLPINPAANSVSIQQFIRKEDGTIQPLQNRLNPSVVPTDVTGSSGFGVVVQNVTGYDMQVGATGFITGGSGTLSPFIGPTSAPAMPLPTSSATHPGADNCSVFFVVPAGWFYKLTTDFLLALSRVVEYRMQ